MDPKQLARQMMHFNKIAFDNTFDAMTVLQEQMEKMISRYLEQSFWLPAEGKAAINEWVNAYKKGRNDFRAAVDDNYRKVEDFFTGQDKGNDACAQAISEHCIRSPRNKEEKATRHL